MRSGGAAVCAQALAKVDAQIADVEHKINAVEASVRQVEEQLTDPEQAHLRDHLHTKVQQLRTKEEQLRTEKEQLRLLQLQQQTGSMSVAGSSVADGQKRPRPPSSSRLEEIKCTKHRVDSPSRGDPSRQLLRAELAVFSLQPLLSVPSLIPPAASMSKTCHAETAALDPRSLLREDQFYPLATEFLPAWVTSQSRGSASKRNAESLYGPSDCVTTSVPVDLPWSCEPELFTNAPNLHPAFNGEVKSAGAEMYNEVLTYITLGMLKGLFSCTSQRFYAAPPIGYGIVAFPHIGYLVAVEWIGKLFMAPVSQPFYLGSPEHESAISALPDVHFDACIEVPTAGGAWASYPAGSANAQVIWSTKPIERSSPAGVQHRFYKMIYCTALDHLGRDRGATRLRALYETYGALARALDGTQPPSLSPARLWFGAFAVLVDMEWKEGQHPEEGKLDNDEHIVDSIARALAWLASRRLLYCDVREQNVLICQHNSVHLIDYDDIVLVDRVPTCLETFQSLLMAAAHKRGESDYGRSLQSVPNICRRLDVLLREVALS